MLKRRSFGWLILVGACALGLLACGQRPERCGNGLRDPGEACEGQDLGGATCLEQGFRSGALGCTDSCALDTSGCSMEEFCSPACEPALCQTCYRGQCTSSCRDWESCAAGICQSDAIEITLFFTSDEHGWLKPYDDGMGTIWGGMANLMARLRSEGYDPTTDSALLLSDGDMWTGPAVTTAVAGESAVQVMNAMGYSAAAVGNHEFDFGRQALLDRSQEAAFPFLTANLQDATTGGLPEFASAWTIAPVKGVQIGFIGLIVADLFDMVCGTHLEGLQLISHEQALRDTVPRVLAAGADMLVVVAHVCPDDLAALSPVAAELGISLMSAGHCHQSSTGVYNGVVVVSPGANGNNYGRVDLLFDPASATVVQHVAAVRNNRYAEEAGNPVVPDQAVAALVDGWQAQVDEELGERVGYTESGLTRDGWCMYNMVVDAWLDQLPQADVAINNLGSLRANLPPGEIDLLDTMAVQPFENELVLLTLSGAQLLSVLDGHWGTSVGGMVVRGDGAQMQVTIENEQLDPFSNYTLVTTDFLYCLPDYFPFDFDPEDVTFSGLHWRGAVEAWLWGLDSNPEDPLEAFLDCAWRWSD